jgi:hypothetical protein
MQNFTRRSFGRVLAASVVLLFVFVGGAADAKSKSKVRKSDARLVSFDREAGTMTVKEKGKKVTYKVRFDGSVMTRTTATMNAKPVKLEDIPVKAPLIVYWLKDEDEPKRRFARKVDAPKIPKEWLEDFDK